MIGTDFMAHPLGSSSLGESTHLLAYTRLLTLQWEKVIICFTLVHLHLTDKGLIYLSQILEENVKRSNKRVGTSTHTKCLYLL